VSGWSELAAPQGRPKIHCRQVKPSEEFLGFARNAFDATLDLAGLRE